MIWQQPFWRLKNMSIITITTMRTTTMTMNTSMSITTTKIMIMTTNMNIITTMITDLTAPAAVTTMITITLMKYSTASDSRHPDHSQRTRYRRPSRSWMILPTV